MLLNPGDSLSGVGWLATPVPPRTLSLLVLAGPLWERRHGHPLLSGGGLVSGALAQRGLGHHHGQPCPAAVSGVRLL